MLKKVMSGVVTLALISTILPMSVSADNTRTPINNNNYSVLETREHGETIGRDYNTVLFIVNGEDSGPEYGYCCDSVTEFKQGNTYKQYKLEDYFTKNKAEHIRAIVNNSYPLVPLSTVKNQINYKIFTPLAKNAITATQAAIWKYSNGLNLDDYRDFNKEIMDIYDYLTGLNGQSSNFGTLVSDFTATADYDEEKETLTVIFSPDKNIPASEISNFSISFKDQSQKLKDLTYGNNSYTAIFNDVKDVDDCVLYLTGSQKLTDVFVYLAQGDSQAMVSRRTTDVDINLSKNMKDNITIIEKENPSEESTEETDESTEETTEEETTSETTTVESTTEATTTEATTTEATTTEATTTEATTTETEATTTEATTTETEATTTEATTTEATTTEATTTEATTTETEATTTETEATTTEATTTETEATTTEATTTETEATTTEPVVTEPEVTEPVVTEPAVTEVIPDNDVPLSNVAGATMTDDTEAIEDDPVPLSNIPTTGDTGYTAMLIGLIPLVVLGGTYKYSKNKKAKSN